MATLNEHAFDILTEYGKYSIGSMKWTDLKETVKRLIKQRYALYVRRDIERNGGSDEFYQTITAELIKVDKSEAECMPVGCTILRTKNKIPKAVRLKTPTVFKFVGSLDRAVIFTKTQLEELYFTFSNDFTADVARYIYKDGYIYVFNRNKIKNIAIEGIFIDVVDGSICPTSEGCPDIYADDTEYPVPDDIMALIRTEVLTEISNA